MAHLDANCGSGASVAAACDSHVIDMAPQLDARSHSAAAADDHNHATEMARRDTSGRRGSCTAAADDDKGHVVIDIETGGRVSTGSDGIASCVVCMEPLEWVAVGPCGHRVVCSACAARVRSAPNSDHRCCICRRLCPTVLVTKAAAAPDGELTFSKMPPAGTKDEQVSEYWYSAAMSAYFDDERQYEAAALKQRQPPSSLSDDDDGGQQYGTAQFLMYSLYAALFGAAIGFTFAIDATGWGLRVGIVLGSAAVSVALGSVAWFMRKYGHCCCRQQQQDA